MNTLGSWIDQEAFSGLAKEIAPPSAELVSPWFAGDTAPVTRLMAEDFRQPEHFAAGPFPETAPVPGATERGRVRSFLESIRLKAEQSGLIPRGGPGTGMAPPARQADTAGTDAAIPHGLTAPVAPTAGNALSGSQPVPAPAVAAASGWTQGLDGSGTGLPPELGELAPLGPPPRRHVPHFEVPLGPLTTRLRALTDWIRRQIDAADIFIIDAQGCPVSDREASGDIVAGAVLLAEASRRAAPHLPSAAEGAVYLDLQDESRLCVIDTSTRHGTFTLGLIVPDALAPRAADRLRRALRRTVEAEGQPLSLPPRERW